MTDVSNNAFFKAATKIINKDRIIFKHNDMLGIIQLCNRTSQHLPITDGISSGMMESIMQIQAELENIIAQKGMSQRDVMTAVKQATKTPELEKLIIMAFEKQCNKMPEIKPDKSSDIVSEWARHLHPAEVMRLQLQSRSTT